MYYAFIENNKINGTGQVQCLTEEIQSIEISEEIYNNINKYIWDETNQEVILNPEWEEEQTLKRKENFENNFLLTSKGNYRLQPRGYSNAQQSVDTINGMVNALGALNEQIAQMIIFYPTPDFTKEEECTEEWLVAHQYNAEPMTKKEWTEFYIEFSTLYAQEQYRKSNENTAN